MNTHNKNYIPALKYNWLTSLYDPLLDLTMKDKIFRRDLIAQANIQPGNNILDIGCGTATLALQLKATHSDAQVTGLDGDSNILNTAREKATRLNLNITLDEGMSFELPYEDETFDCAFSALFFHHLTREKRMQTLSEAYRVLRPSGELHVADWGKSQNILMRLAFYGVQFLDGFETTRDNVKGLLPSQFRDAGFKCDDAITNYMTVFGTLSMYKAHKSSGPE